VGVESNYGWSPGGPLEQHKHDSLKKKTGVGGKKRKRGKEGKSCYERAITSKGGVWFAIKDEKR